MRGSSRWLTTSSQLTAEEALSIALRWTKSHGTCFDLVARPLPCIENTSIQPFRGSMLPCAGVGPMRCILGFVLIRLRVADQWRITKC